MAQVKLSLSTLTPDQKVQLGTEIVASMTGNGQFTTPNPPLTTLTALTSNLQDAITAHKAAQQAALMATLAVRAAESQFDTALTAEAAYVQNASGGNESAILSTGMGVRGAPVAVGILPAPGALSATAGDLPGEIDLHWNPVANATNYLLQWTPDPLSAASVWTPLVPSTKSKTHVLNLTSGTRYWFRAATLSSAGQGPWSDPATKLAP